MSARADDTADPCTRSETRTRQKEDADNNADRRASETQHRRRKEDLFQPGPQYDKNYNAKGQVDIYGAKVAVEPPRPRSR